MPRIRSYKRSGTISTSGLKPSWTATWIRTIDSLLPARCETSVLHFANTCSYPMNRDSVSKCDKRTTAPRYEKGPQEQFKVAVSIFSILSRIAVWQVERDEEAH